MVNVSVPTSSCPLQKDSLPTSLQALPLPTTLRSLLYADTQSVSTCRKMSLHPGPLPSPSRLSPQQPLTAVVTYRTRKQPFRMLLKEAEAREGSGFTRIPFPKQVMDVSKYHVPSFLFKHTAKFNRIADNLSFLFLANANFSVPFVFSKL